MYFTFVIHVCNYLFGLTLIWSNNCFKLVEKKTFNSGNIYWTCQKAQRYVTSCVHKVETTLKAMFFWIAIIFRCVLSRTSMKILFIGDQTGNQVLKGVALLQQSHKRPNPMNTVNFVQQQLQFALSKNFMALRRDPIVSSICWVHESSLQFKVYSHACNLGTVSQIQMDVKVVIISTHQYK